MEDVQCHIIIINIQGLYHALLYHLWKYTKRVNFYAT